jgi:hypothetical protein
VKLEDVFSHVVENAFDFLEKALDEFDQKNYKYSVIHFCASVELFLKARLILEHWSLIWSKKEEPDLDAFLSGNFDSAGLRDIKKRLERVCRDGLSIQAAEAFDALVMHRNKVIHFCHPGLIAAGDVSGIVGEQCRAWHHLHELLSNRWAKQFSAFTSRIGVIVERMRSHGKFLEERFEQQKDLIESEKARGFYFHICPGCGFLAMRFFGETAHLFVAECFVCGLKKSAVQIDCPQCAEQVVFIGEGFSECKCGKKLDSKDLFEEMFDHREADVRFKDGDDSYRAGNCCSCDTRETVIPYYGEYFCLNCFETFRHVYWCEWCQEPQTDDTEGSGLCGCQFCEGRLGYEKDD